MDSVLAVRQSDSAPTCEKPTTIKSSLGALASSVVASASSLLWALSVLSPVSELTVLLELFTAGCQRKYHHQGCK